MATVDITIDGESIKAAENQSILEAARENGRHIPALCHDPRLEPFGACRLCLVEIEGGRRPVPACATKVSAGMVVKTDTGNLNSMRKMALELLLSAHYGDCEAPCKRACPAGIDIQGFVAFIADGQYDEAARLIREQLPFPAAVGRVCPAFCEKSCRRNLVDEPVAICDLKRFAGDFDLDSGSTPDPLPPTGFRVAVVGGGPAGLSAAYYLALQGHDVTILEASEKLGGMMRYGIPEYRLPKDLLDRELAGIIKLCREVKYSAVLGRDFTLEGLRKDFDAVFLAIGAQKSQKLGIPGEDLAGVYHGTRFLRDVALGKEVRLGSRVAVVGGGNTAIDCARTALRLGAQEVFVLYRRSEEEMPASAEEVTEAREEGVVFQFLVNPTRLIGIDGRVQSCQCVRMALGEPDRSGRRRPVAVPGSEFLIQVDDLICAVGQRIDTSCVSDGDGGELLENNSLYAFPDTQKTRLEGVFAGGDCVSGPATVVEAVAAGKRASLAINRFLQDREEDLPPRPYDHSKGDLSEIHSEEYKSHLKIPRTRKVALEAKARKNSFKEVSDTFTVEMAEKEAMRCLSCGCVKAFDCQLRDLATKYEVRQDSYVMEKHAHFIQEGHPHIARDINKCILCGSCVRICSEVQGIGALGFVGRGFQTVVKPSLGIPLSETLCDSCGQCISACPTGALTAKTFLPKPIPWKGEKVRTVCPQCNINCDLELKISGKKIIGASSPLFDSVNEGNLCKKGSFGYGFVHGRDRITRPLVRKEGRLVEVSWPEAIATACLGLSKIRDHLGGDALAVLASPNLTNEESYLVQKLARVALRTNNLDSIRPLSADVLINFRCSLEDLEKADLAVVYKCDPAVDCPVVANKLRKMLARGARLVFIGPRVTRFDREARMTLKVNPGEAKYLLAGVLNYFLHYDLLIPEDAGVETGPGAGRLLAEIQNCEFYGLEELIRIKPAKLIDFTHLYLRARKPVILVDAEKTDASELQMLRFLKQVKINHKKSTAGIFTFYPYGNLYGQAFMGVNPELLPGCRALTDMIARGDRLWGEALPGFKGKPDIAGDLANGNIMGLLAVVNDGINLEGLIKESAFKVVITPLLTREISQANVVLPGATFAETQGTFMDAEGRRRTLNRALAPPGGKENHRILAELITGLGYAIDYGSIADLQKEIDEMVFSEHLALPVAQPAREYVLK